MVKPPTKTTAVQAPLEPPPKPRPRCPHGLAGGLQVIVTGEMKRRFRCDRCRAIAPDPVYGYQAWQKWIAEHPGLNIEVHCLDKRLDEVAQAVWRATLEVNYGTLDDVDAPADSVYARQVLGHCVEQLEPGRVAQVLADGQDDEVSP